MEKAESVNTMLTPASEKFIRRMLRFCAGPQAGFRLKVAPGGCSGFAAEFDLDAEPKSGEIVWEPSGLRIFLDAGSRLLLNGMIVDFVETLWQTGFVFTSQNMSPASGLVSVDSLLRR
jgi:iron-sulfur cluster assembly protein